MKDFFREIQLNTSSAFYYCCDRVPSSRSLKYVQSWITPSWQHSCEDRYGPNNVRTQTQLTIYLFVYLFVCLSVYCVYIYLFFFFFFLASLFCHYPSICQFGFFLGFFFFFWLFVLDCCCFRGVMGCFLLLLLLLLLLLFVLFSVCIFIGAIALWVIFLCPKASKKTISRASSACKAILNCMLPDAGSCRGFFFLLSLSPFPSPTGRPKGVESIFCAVEAEVRTVSWCFNAIVIVA